MAKCCAWATHPAAVERIAGISSRNSCAHLDTWRIAASFTHGIRHGWRGHEEASLHGMWRQARPGSPIPESMGRLFLGSSALLQRVLRGSERIDTPKRARPLVLLSHRDEYPAR